MNFVKNILITLRKRILQLLYFFVNLFYKTYIKTDLENAGIRHIRFWSSLKKVLETAEFRTWGHGKYRGRKVFIKIGNDPTIKNEIYIIKNIQNPTSVLLMPIFYFKKHDILYIVYPFLLKNRKMFELKNKSDIDTVIDDFLVYLDWAKKNSFVHCDISFGNTCFYEGKLILIDLGQSLIKTNPSKENKRIRRNGYRFSLNEEENFYIIDDAYSFMRVLKSNRMAYKVSDEQIERISKCLGCAEAKFFL